MIRSSLTFLGSFFLLFATVSCTSTAPQQTQIVAPAAQASTISVEPPFVGPPSLSPDSWALPDYGRRRPFFPFLPGEDQTQTLSVGAVTNGHLVNAQPISLPHPHLLFLERQYQRKFLYTTPAMLALLEDAMDHVRQEYPDALLRLGNLSREGGGSIPQSASHHSGRDADVAFFVLDANGLPSAKPDLIPFDATGWFRSHDHEDPLFEDLSLYFDAPRNWRFIEGLILSEAADLQYIFISHPLRDMLLAEARRRGTSPRILRDATRLLVQPAGALPHDDHFHIRIHCTDADLAAGCVETGRPGPRFQPDRRLRQEAIALAASLLDNPAPDLRVAAIQRLHLLEPHSHTQALHHLVNDDSPRVRIAAIRTLGSTTRDLEVLTQRLASEDNGHVLAELITALPDFGAPASPFLINALSTDHTVNLGPAGQLSYLSLVADALAQLEDPKSVPYLIETLPDAPPSARPQVLHALRVLTNHHLTQGSALHDLPTIHSRWKHWWDSHRELRRDEWLALGFQQAGFAVDALDLQYVWEICRAINEDLEPHLVLNAQRILIRFAGRDPGSLRWHPYDASFYWRRFFERRQDELGLPTIPEELSTASGYIPRSSVAK